MADKVKLTPPMTDSKTPEWVKEETSDLYELVSDATSTAKAKAEISQALLSAYERGRKEGIEEAAKVAEDIAAKNAGYSDSPGAARVLEAIRQLLEVKG